ncbi:hypothetical protein Cni_G04168 [Canna indica]|uniref:DUF4283 domain-containing protein n=1 Tax=Canna indica TaxID=4628 RepID=A0AAQ3JT43_9LILI|nr:hypothetical protein Cni_G04168 [Canna indica]
MTIRESSGVNLNESPLMVTDPDPRANPNLRSTSPEDELGKKTTDQPTLKAKTLTSGTNTLSWAQILRGLNPKSVDLVTSTTLSRIQSQSSCKVSFLAEQIQEWQSPWHASLIGKFLGNLTPLSVISRWAFNLWSSYGLVNMMDIEEGFFVFRFRSQDQATNVLSSGPWSCRGDVMHLVPWKPFFCPWMECFSYAPVWLRIHALPLELWNPVSPIVYENLPSVCFKCGIIGHKEISYPDNKDPSVDNANHVEANHDTTENSHSLNNAVQENITPLKQKTDIA